MQKWGETEAKKRGAFFDIQRKMQGLQSELFELDRHLSDHRVERARIETRRDAIEREAQEIMGEEAKTALEAAPEKDVDAQSLSPASTSSARRSPPSGPSTRPSSRNTRRSRSATTS